MYKPPNDYHQDNTDKLTQNINSQASDTITTLITESLFVQIHIKYILVATVDT